MIAAHNERLSQVLPDRGMAALLRFMHSIASNTFQRVSPDQPVSPSGRGIILYPNSNPESVSVNHFVVTESDKGNRELIRHIEGSINHTDVPRLVAGMREDAVCRSKAGRLVRVPILRPAQAPAKYRYPCVLQTETKNQQEL